MEAYVKGKRIRLDPQKSVGKGGEADVFDVGSGRVLKYFKPPNHPDLKGFDDEQKAARLRIAEHQKKLQAFPKLPSRVITPLELATDKSEKKIVGYTMPFIQGGDVLHSYGSRKFRQLGINNDTIGKIFADLHGTVQLIHDAGVVIGDFNDLNVIVVGQEAYIIDADSMQFGKFMCRVFTAKFVDPLNCDPSASGLMLVNPHSADSDWYAYSVMLMQSLLFVDPYGGVYRPKDKTKQVKHDARPLHRLTVFGRDVRYPKPAVPFMALPDDLLQYFYQVFMKDKRGEFPMQLIDGFRWTICNICGTEHARQQCPKCSNIPVAAIKEVITVRGSVTATRVFMTSGVVLFSTVQHGKLKWLYHEDDKYRREDGGIVMGGSLDPKMRFRIRGRETLLGKNGQVVTLDPHNEPSRLAVESFGKLPLFDANQDYRYWIDAGQLKRDGQYGPEYIGDVLNGQTLIWMGETFGFGMYRAGNLNVAFVFDAKRKGINDQVNVTPIRGRLIDATCVFAKDRCWYLTSSEERGKTINRCVVIRPDGAIESQAEVEQGTDNWLGQIRGKCAAGDFMLAATDDGIVRVEAVGTKLEVTREFPDTEPFVNTGNHLFVGNDGLYVVDRHKVMLLKIR